MITRFKSLFVSLFVVAFMLGTVACSTSSLVTILATVADASSVAVTLVTGLSQAGTISKPVATQIVAYASAVSTAASESVTELDSTDTTVVQATKIATYFAGVATPLLAPGTNAEVQASVQAVADAVQLFLAQIHTGSTALATVSAPTHVKFSHTDKKNLTKIKSKADATTAAGKTFLNAVKK